MAKKVRNPAFARLILSLVSLTLVCLVLVVQTFAWFAMRNMVNSDDMEMSLIKIILDDTNVSIKYDDDKNDELVLLPGDYSKVEINIENTTKQDQIYLLKLQNIRVSYPKYRNETYADKHIDTDMYYKSGALYDYKTDARYIADRQQFFRTFVSPVSNAISYNVSNVPFSEFDDTFTPLDYSLTYEGVASEADQQSIKSYRPAGDINGLFVFDDYGEEGAINTTIVEAYEEGDMRMCGIKVPAGETGVIFMLMYFNPDRYVTNTDGVILKNSNPYLKQRLWLELAIDVSL